MHVCCAGRAFRYMSVLTIAAPMDHKITRIGFLSILSISLPTRESGIRRDKYLSAAIFKKAVMIHRKVFNIKIVNIHFKWRKFLRNVRE